MSVEKIAMLPLAEIVDELLRLPQRWEAEIGRSRSANRPVHGTDAHLDLVLGVVLYGLDLPVNIAPTLGFRQILVTPGVRADGVPGGGHLLEDAGLVGGMQADREEERLGAMGGERGEHRWGVLRPGAVVEGEHYLAFAQEIMALEMLESEAGPAGGVDFDHARNPQGIGIAARGRHGGRHRRLLSGGRRRPLGGIIRGAESPALSGCCLGWRGRRYRKGGFL